MKIYDINISNREILAIVIKEIDRIKRRDAKK